VRELTIKDQDHCVDVGHYVFFVRFMLLRYGLEKYLDSENARHL